MVKQKKKIFQIAAILVSFLLFILLLYANLAKDRNGYIDQLNEQTQLIRDRFDQELKVLINDLPALTKAISPFFQCTDQIIDTLGEFAFTHPQLSTIAVKGKKQTGWCIAPEFHTLVVSKNTNPGKKLIGPVVNAHTNQTFFILQYPGSPDIKYHLYLLDSIFIRAINTQNPMIDNVSIMTKAEKVLFQTQPRKIDASDGELSLESIQPSRIVPNLLIRVDGNEQYIQADNWKKLTSLHLFSLAIASLFLITLLIEVNRRFSMTNLLKQALRYNEFYPVFQPIFDATTHRIIGAEVLIRWQDRYGEQIMPSQFIEEAEHSKHIVAITNQLIKHTFEQLGSYLKENRFFHLGFNLCRAHLVDKTWLQTLLMLCQSYDIKPQQVMLEITERTIIGSTEVNLIERLQALHHAGFILAIDDFGTSHASISFLRHFPMDYLKIDSMYVQAIGTGAVTEALIEPIILIANQLKLKIIAEGVETESQLTYLKQNKVDFIQGWYFAKAMNAADLLQLLERK